CGQRKARRGIAVAHCGHSFVDGDGGVGLARIRSIWRTSTKIAKATITKLMIVLMKTPLFRVAAPAAFAAASDGYEPPDSVTKRSAKLTPPNIRPIGGIRMSATNDVT